MSLEKWRNFIDHRLAQKEGKNNLFSHYRIRVYSVERDYTQDLRSKAPPDSISFHD